VRNAGKHADMAAPGLVMPVVQRAVARFPWCSIDGHVGAVLRVRRILQGNLSTVEEIETELSPEKDGP